MHVQCWREAYAEIVPAKLLASFDASKRVDHWRKYIADPSRIVLAAFDNSVPVGLVNAGIADETYFEGQDGHIAALYVLASHHKMGIGRRLVGGVADLWLKRGGKTLAVGVLAENLKARRFYEALGARFVRAGTYVWDGYELPDAIYVFEDLPSLIP
jgi:GNAT superfamily N-acetyltransferase